MGRSLIGSDRKYVHYSDSQLDAVRNTDMIDFLSRKEGFVFKQTGRYFKCTEHNSLVVYPDRKMWVWNSQRLNGLNCIDWLMKVDGYSFQEAAEQLIQLDSDISTSFRKSDVLPVRNKEPPVLTLPPKKDGRYSNVYMYLTKTRCIEHDIVMYCFKQHLIYQDERNNAVFLGYDENNNVKFAELRGTASYYDNSDRKFRGNPGGIDPYYGFELKCDKSRQGADVSRVYIFESPIDLLSHATMTVISERKRNGDTYDKNCWQSQNRLSLSGNSNVALEGYLKRNPQITTIECCLDNDDGGRKGTEWIKKAFGDRYNINVHRLKMGKDYNDALQLYCSAATSVQTITETKQPKR